MLPFYGQLFESKGIRLIKQAPYSPDLNILDRWMNRKIKEELNRKNLKNHIEVIQETRNVLQKLKETDLKHQIDSSSSSMESDQV